MNECPHILLFPKLLCHTILGISPPLLPGPPTHPFSSCNPKSPVTLPSLLLIYSPPHPQFPTLLGHCPPRSTWCHPPQISPLGSTITPQPRHYLAAPSSGLTIASTSQGSHIWKSPRSRPPPAPHLVAPSPVSPLRSTRSECHF